MKTKAHSYHIQGRKLTLSTSDSGWQEQIEPYFKPPKLDFFFFWNVSGPHEDFWAYYSTKNEK